MGFRRGAGQLIAPVGSNTRSASIALTMRRHDVLRGMQEENSPRQQLHLGAEEVPEGAGVCMLNAMRRLACAPRPAHGLTNSDPACAPRHDL